MDSASLVQALRTFLGGRDAAVFAKWCDIHKQALEVMTSRGEFIKLKRGDRSVARIRLQTLAPCAECSDLPWSFPAPNLDSRADFARMFDILTASKALERRSGSLFVCRACGAERFVNLPEREFSGEIRVAG